jgi:hypothetical protein
MKNQFLSRTLIEVTRNSSFLEQNLPMSNFFKEFFYNFYSPHRYMNMNVWLRAHLSHANFSVFFNTENTLTTIINIIVLICISAVIFIQEHIDLKKYIF